MTSQRPYLILGDTLRAYLQEQKAKSKVTLQPDQLLCLTCKTGRKPLGLMVDLHPQNAKTARLVGLCEVCDGTCNRMISRAKLDQFRTIFDLVSNDSMQA